MPNHMRGVWEGASVKTQRLPTGAPFAEPQHHQDAQILL